MVKGGDKRKMERRKNGKINILMIAVAVVLLLSLSIFNVTATADKSIPRVVDYKILHDIDYDWYSVVGEVINPTNSTIYCIRVTGRLYDSNGIFLEEDTDETYLEYVEQNQTVPFKLSFSSVDGTPKNCKFSLEWNKHKTEGLEISENSIYAEGNRVRGVTMNSGNASSTDVIVTGTCYKGYNTVIDVDYDRTYSQIESNDTDSFSLTFDYAESCPIKYDLQVEGTSWDNTNLAVGYNKPFKGGKAVCSKITGYVELDSGWRYNVRGTIKNTGDKPIYCASVEMVIYYKTDYGQSSSVRHEDVLLDYIAPGQKAPFRARCYCSGYPTNAIVSGIKINKHKVEGLLITDIAIEEDKITGWVKNNGNEIAEDVYIVGTTYDETGKITDVEERSVTYDPLLIGEKENFEFRNLDADKNYTLQVEGIAWERISI